jgi:hypothetical protein
MMTQSVILATAAIATALLCTRVIADELDDRRAEENAVYTQCDNQDNLEQAIAACTKLIEMLDEDRSKIPEADWYTFNHSGVYGDVYAVRARQRYLLIKPDQRNRSSQSMRDVCEDARKAVEFGSMVPSDLAHAEELVKIACPK